MATQLQKHVEKQKKEAERKFSSWFINKFKKNKTQYIRDKDEKAAEAERLRRQKNSSSSMTASASSSSLSSSSKRDPSSDGPSLQRQQSFLRAQLLEMKRHSQEMLMHAKHREESSDEEEYDEVHSVLGNDDENNNAPHEGGRSRSTSRTRRSLDGNQSIDNQTDDEDEEKKGNHTDDEDHNYGGGSLRNSFTSNGGGSQRNSFTGGSQRNSVSEELDRRSSRATSLYEEAISALEEVLHPDKPVTRVRRSDSATKRLFDKPENEWI